MASEYLRVVSKADSYDRDTNIALGTAGVGAAGAGAGSIRAAQHGSKAAQLRASLPPPQKTWKFWKRPQVPTSANKLVGDIIRQETLRSRSKVGAAAGLTTAAGGLVAAHEIQRAKRANQPETAVVKSAFGVEHTVSKLEMPGMARFLKPLKSVAPTLKAMPGGVKSAVQGAGPGLMPKIKAGLSVPGAKTVAGGAAGGLAVGVPMQMHSNAQRNNQY